MKFTSISTFLSLAIIFLASLYLESVNAVASVTTLEPGSSAHVLPEVGKFGYTMTRMNIYCYVGRPKDLSLLLQSISLFVNIDNDDFTIFSGHSPAEVEQAHESHKSIFSFNLLSRSKKRAMNLNTFNTTCIGLETAEEYQVSLNLIRLDLTKLALLTIGVFVFFSATNLSRNNGFFYIVSVLLGNFASILVLIWFISKLIPKKPLMYGVLASGWTLAAYFAQIIFDNIQTIFFSYQKYVYVYVLVSSIISFAVCYYKGPPKSDRSKDLIKWGLQLLGLISIFFSSDLREATVGILLTCVVIYYMPLDFFGWVGRAWRRKFPPKRKLLTREEFEEQGRIETEKALAELRGYVKSPKCKEQWKLVMNLSQPSRFASFVEGDEHLTMDETMEYENALHTMELSSDDTSNDEIEESLAVDENCVPINKSRLSKLQNGSSQKYKSFNRSAQVTSSTPNNRLRTRAAQSESRRAQNDTFEISDDE